MNKVVIVEDIQSIRALVFSFLQSRSSSLDFHAVASMNQLDQLLKTHFPQVALINFHFSSYRFQYRGLEAFVRIKAKEISRQEQEIEQIISAVFWGVEEEHIFWESLHKRCGESLVLLQGYSGCSYLKFPFSECELLASLVERDAWANKILTNRDYALYRIVVGNLAKGSLEKKLAHLNHELLNYVKGIKVYSRDEIEQHIQDFLSIERAAAHNLQGLIQELKGVILSHVLLKRIYYDLLPVRSNRT